MSTIESPSSKENEPIPIKDMVKIYKGKLERKKKSVEPYRIMKNNYEPMNEKQYSDMNVLEAEINMLIKFINDLEYIQEQLKKLI